MLPPVPCRTCFVAFLAVAFLALASIALFFPTVWRSQSGKCALIATLLGFVGTHATWEYGEGVGASVSAWGMIASTVGVVVLAFVTASVPVAAGVRALLARAFVSNPGTKALAPSLSRRTFVTAVTTLVPLAAAGTAISGFTGAERSVTPNHLFHFEGLHPDLDGLKILQLSDLHLGLSKHLRDLERVLESLQYSRQRPDLIVLTGDVADDLGQLGPALSLVDQFGARFGALACLGNHEYLHDIRASRPIYERGPIPLLVNSGTDLQVGRATLHVTGIDDPIALRQDLRRTLERFVGKAMQRKPQESFSLVLAHRPETFDATAKAGAHLTLSGHTHGGQIGFNGKSAFEPLWPDGYLWGAYRRRESQLYTTSGFGDWFPFRVGCPAEAPILELRRTLA
jgi:uncharacterized protein